jgi:hypothetical protein
MLIAPSPECRILSLPVLALRPMLLSHPEAAAAALLVFAFTLTPLLPPAVRMRFPARPPERYVRSLLNSGDRATAWTGREKLRRVTSLGSMRDETQTWPSMDDVAMKMLLPGVFGRTGCRGVRGDATPASAGPRAGEEVAPSGAGGTATDLILDIGTGCGDTETAVMVAECAWYIRKGWKDGIDSTF